MSPGPAVPKSERILRNAYRVLGLPGEVPWREIRQAAEREGETAWDLPWLGPPVRTPAERALAFSRLLDPHQRLRERMFWFHEAAAEEAARELDPATIRNAMEGWAATTVVAARHDAALVSLIAAIALDPSIEDPALWQVSLRRWAEVLDSEEYWMEVIRVEREGGFEVPAPFGEVYELREAAFGLVVDLPAGIARAALLEGDEAGARRAVETLREALPPELFAGQIGELAEQLERQVAPEVFPLAGEPPAGRAAERGAGVAPEGPAATVEMQPLAASIEGEPPKGEPPAGEAAAGEVAWGEPAEEPPPAPGEPEAPGGAGRTRRRRPRRAIPVAAATVALVAAAAFLVLPLRHRTAGGNTGDGGADRSSIERRLDAGDGEIAELLLARRAVFRDLAHIQSAMRDYEALIADYERRLQYRLNVDTTAYERVRGLHGQALQQHAAARSRLRTIEQGLTQARERSAELIRDYNAGLP